MCVNRLLSDSHLLIVLRGAVALWATQDRHRGQCQSQTVRSWKKINPIKHTCAHTHTPHLSWCGTLHWPKHMPKTVVRVAIHKIWLKVSWNIKKTWDMIKECVSGSSLRLDKSRWISTPWICELLNCEPVQKKMVGCAYFVLKKKNHSLSYFTIVWCLSHSGKENSERKIKPIMCIITDIHTHTSTFLSLIPHIRTHANTHRYFLWEKSSCSCSPWQRGHVTHCPLQKQQLNVDPWRGVNVCGCVWASYLNASSLRWLVSTVTSGLNGEKEEKPIRRQAADWFEVVINTGDVN